MANPSFRHTSTNDDQVSMWSENSQGTDLEALRRTLEQEIVTIRTEMERTALHAQTMSSGEVLVLSRELDAKINHYMKIVQTLKKEKRRYRI